MKSGGSPPGPLYPCFGKRKTTGDRPSLDQIFSRMIKNKKMVRKMTVSKSSDKAKSATIRAPNKGKIKESLIRQLQVKNAVVPHFLDLINDYMQLYDTKKMLQKDIKKRGVAYETMSASGYKITKQNQSVKDLVAVEKQMLSLLKEMGLTTDAPTGEDVLDEDL